MKRLCAFIGIICLMLSAIAIRLRFCRLDVIIDGDYLAYSNNDTPVFFSISKGYERVELDREENVGSILQKLKAQIIKEEKVDDISIIYAYSPILLKSVELFGTRINVMIACTSSAIVVGSPLIKGSF